MSLATITHPSPVPLSPSSREQAEVATILAATCCVISPNTGKMCCNTPRCPMHTNRQRDELASEILGATWETLMGDARALSEQNTSNTRRRRNKKRRRGTSRRRDPKASAARKATREEASATAAVAAAAAAANAGKGPMAPASTAARAEVNADGSVVLVEEQGLVPAAINTGAIAGSGEAGVGSKRTHGDMVMSEVVVSEGSVPVTPGALGSDLLLPPDDLIIGGGGGGGGTLSPAPHTPPPAAIPANPYYFKDKSGMIRVISADELNPDGSVPPHHLEGEAVPPPDSVFPAAVDELSHLAPLGDEVYDVGSLDLLGGLGLSLSPPPDVTASQARPFGANYVATSDSKRTRLGE